MVIELYVMCDSSQNIIILDTTDLSLVATIDRPGYASRMLPLCNLGLCSGEHKWLRRDL
jgi:hypothetical protein